MKLLIISLILFFTGCRLTDRSPYANNLKKLSNELTTHFPKNEKGLMSYTSNIPTGNSTINNDGNFIIAAFKYDLIKDFIIKNETEFNKYYFADSSQIVLSRDQKDLFADTCFCNSISLPTFIVQIDKFNLLGDNFNLENVNLNELRLPEDFEYFAEAKNGIFLDKKLLLKKLKPTDCWAHGYSKGYAISKKRNLAIIWLDLW